MSESKSSQTGGRPDAVPDAPGPPSFDVGRVPEPHSVQAPPGGSDDEQHATGQPMTYAPSYAHWGRRVGAALIDGVIIYIPNRTLHSTVGGYNGARLGATAALLVLLTFCYFAGTTGRTPGKAAVGVRLVRESDGSALGFGLTVGRWFLHILDAISCGIGYLWPIWDDKRQTFADKIVHSLVLKDRSGPGAR